MKKSFNILLAFVIAFFAFPFAGQKASADGEVYDNIKDGTHDIKVKALKKNTNEPSTAADYMDEDATLKISNGQAELTLFIPKNDAMIFKKLELDGIIPSVEDTGDSNAYTYKLKTVVSKIPAVTTYEVPLIGLIHENVELDFELVGLDELPVVEEQPEDTEGDDGSKNGNLIENPDKTATTNYQTDTPMIERYFDNPVTILYKDGKKYIQMNGNSAQFITSLTINGEEVTWGEISEDNTYTVQFELTGNLSDQLDFGMVIDTGNFGPGIMEHEVKLWFDEVGADIEEPEDPKPTPEPEPQEPKPTPEPEPEPEDPDIVLSPDKAYEIDYVIKHEDGIQDSIANDFFTGKAILLEKDGKTYAQLTITSGEMIKELKNKYGKALIVKENDDGSIVVQLRVPNDLSNMKLDMHVVVPAGAIPGFPGYDEKHTAILVFDKNSQKEINADSYKLVGSSNKDNGNGPYTPDIEGGIELGGNKNNNDSPTKPELGENDGKKTGNPKTGDTSKVLLYTLLLISSLIPLAFKLKRRYV